MSFHVIYGCFVCPCCGLPGIVRAALSEVLANAGFMFTDTRNIILDYVDLSRPEQEKLLRLPESANEGEYNRELQRTVGRISQLELVIVIIEDEECAYIRYPLRTPLTESLNSAAHCISLHEPDDDVVPNVLNLESIIEQLNEIKKTDFSEWVKFWRRTGLKQPLPSLIIKRGDLE